MDMAPEESKTREATLRAGHQGCRRAGQGTELEPDPDLQTFHPPVSPLGRFANHEAKSDPPPGDGLPVKQGVRPVWPVQEPKRNSWPQVTSGS